MFTLRNLLVSLLLLLATLCFAQSPAHALIEPYCQTEGRKFLSSVIKEDDGSFGSKRLIVALSFEEAKALLQELLKLQDEAMMAENLSNKLLKMRFEGEQNGQYLTTFVTLVMDLTSPEAKGSVWTTDGFSNYPAQVEIVTHASEASQPSKKSKKSSTSTDSEVPDIFQNTSSTTF
ncbi:MAG: hypothetical protein LIO90_07845 [Bacteroidales bacterium]|nr:hypothetical protein [Bacteroidales bacterium]